MKPKKVSGYYITPGNLCEDFENQAFDPTFFVGDTLSDALKGLFESGECWMCPDCGELWDEYELANECCTCKFCAEKNKTCDCE